ncbi:AAA-domain-containing protein [Hypoxylon trugodes]|uniref:AAA-domain-containing protein n=1 Tax=Hypoxylon trugodes TaxID=326681 RepID=UPI00219D132E|nr:AAA-domain-containing protein [Hypoxylon trugodes]KAI1382811.1 AAA-domain-containing protein [Hypoxylon trugodes]
MDMRNNLFGRGPRSGLPGRQVQQDQGGYSQVPQNRPSRDYAGPPEYDPRGAHGAPSPGYGGAPQQRNTRPSAPSGRKVQLRLAKLEKGDLAQQYIFSNRCAVSPQDFPPDPHGQDIHILLNGNFVVTARPTEYIPPGCISLSDPQRTWCGISMTDIVVGEKYENKVPLSAMDIEVGFASQRKVTDVPYDQDELADDFIKMFQGQIFAPGQRLIMDYKGIPLMFVVKTVQLLELLGNEKGQAAESSSRPDARGLLLGNTSEISFFKDAKNPIKLKGSTKRPATNAILRPDFKFADMGIGGLDDEFSTIFRRAFASRVFPPGLVEQMGISHVKGVLLYGPPGTGKTLIARQIGKMLNAREPKIINGPEILNKYVGQSEENVRKMFADAEKEYKEKGEESGLHIIIFDELDAVCKQRGSGSGGTGVGDSVVNQLLSKLDGVDQLNNILLIGMTNRKDMIDDALLRPGRLEVHVEISLPDEHGRVQILNIHTAKIRAINKLGDDVSLDELAHLTKNYSGAEISGLVKAALSYAFTRHTKLGDVTGVQGNPQDVMLTRADFMRALEDVKPAFGVSEEELNNAAPYGIIDYSPHIQSILSTGLSFVQAVRTSEKSPLFSVLVHGTQGAGKTALAAEIGLKSEFPFVKLVRPIDVGTNEGAKLEYLRRVFSDAYKSALSIVILDSVEKIIDWNPIGPRFSNAVVQYLGAVLETRPPKNRRLLIIATTSQRSMLDQHGVFAWDREIAVPSIKDHRELQALLAASGKFNSPADINEALNELQTLTGTQEVGIGVKAVFSALETAAVRDPLPISLAEDISAIIASRNPQGY